MWLAFTSVRLIQPPESWRATRWPSSSAQWHSTSRNCTYDSSWARNVSSKPTTSRWESSPGTTCSVTRHNVSLQWH